MPAFRALSRIFCLTLSITAMSLPQRLSSTVFCLSSLKTGTAAASREFASYLISIAVFGLFQALSIIPGTSRSGSTIIGGLVIGVSRVTAAEFTFFLAVPVMVGVSLLKIIAFGFSFTSAELITLIVGCVVAFLVSVVVIKFLMSYIKRKDFKVFGWYRIILGVVVIAYFLLK